MDFSELFIYFTNGGLEQHKTKSHNEPGYYSQGRLQQFEDSAISLINMLGYTIENYDILLQDEKFTNEVQKVLTQLLGLFMKSLKTPRTPRDPERSLAALPGNIAKYRLAQLKRIAYPSTSGLGECLAPSSYKEETRVKLQWEDIDATSLSWDSLSFKQRCGAVFMRKGDAENDVKSLFLEKPRLGGVYQLPKGRRFLCQDPHESAIHEARVWVGVGETGDESTDEESSDTGALVTKPARVADRPFDITPMDIVFPTRFDIRKGDRDNIRDEKGNGNRRLRNRYKGRDLGNGVHQKTGATLIANQDVLHRTMFLEPSNKVASFMDWYAAKAENPAGGKFQDQVVLTDRKDAKKSLICHWLTPAQVSRSGGIATHEREAVDAAVTFYKSSPKQFNLTQ
ncbi:hypothetical protein PG996_016011 [Apiospora saccharicola]|uniref:Uncharacterized protein n=1 Tax=Apiospora saccharicola TaxID=335842 RepID=A0ABR1TNC8_9PEZI